MTNQSTTFESTSKLRARFAAALSAMYGQEVPAYRTLVEVAGEVNAATADDGRPRLGGFDRVTAERHGAIRVGTPSELRQVGKVFRGFGMYPVGFYDLRDTGATPVPVVSTAFRPIDSTELEANPFRVFTSMLTVDDERFFSPGLRDRLKIFLGARTLFGDELLVLARRATDDAGLSGRDADRFVGLATAAFELSSAPTNRAWHRELADISAVAADIGGVASTHINHLTPRVLDIDELYRRLQSRGIQMIDKIQGPPRWSGPDVLLRQTSFRALDESRRFIEPDGAITVDTTRVRFGEVEQRGIALTPRGRERYDLLMRETDLAHQQGASWQDAGRSVWEASDFPTDETGLRRLGLGYFDYRVTPGRGRTLAPGLQQNPSLQSLIDAGVIEALPIIYEDFLPRSAAGIFQSNLVGRGGQPASSDKSGTVYGIDWLAHTLGTCVHIPEELYAAQSDRSLHICANELGLDPSSIAPADHNDTHLSLEITMHTAPIPAHGQLSATASAALARIGVDLGSPADGDVPSRSPINGETLARLLSSTSEAVDAAVTAAHQAFTQWRLVPAPRRGDLVRRLRELLTEHKSDLATLVTLEAGKIESEALGEVQEMIDVCDFAVGLSRQLYGHTMPSERPGHRLSELWHPLGVVGVITAFNFPVAVWAWNTAIALVAGDTVVWKPSEVTPLTAVACTSLLDRAAREMGIPAGIHHLVQGGRDVGERIVDDPRVALVSATGSVRMGRTIGPRVAARFGRSLLELGGNNAAIVAPSADLDLAVRGIVFSAAGTAGQRCTSLRRLIVHRSIADEVVTRISNAYRQLSIGNPLEAGTLVGPLIHEAAYRAFELALEKAQADGGILVTGGERTLAAGAPDAYYVQPAVVTMPYQTSVVHDETFAPILYVLSYDTFDEAIELNNAVPQGLSSAIFTSDQREAELFVSAAGSDCGIANVNLGTSGAEIGGAFGGEKETGGGRESGSDSWKAYMRRSTSTVNYSSDLPLSQGVNFI